MESADKPRKVGWDWIFEQMSTASHVMPTQVVDLRPCYPIYILAGAIADSFLFTQTIASKKVMIITNETVAPLYLDCLKHTLKTYECHHLILKDGEQFKNHTSLLKIYQALIQYKHTRQSTLIALGGGVIGDITGFAAATYMRGIPWVNVPTSLLAQVDASIGGKTGVNLPEGKNLIGAFYQPRAVMIDPNTLETLPNRALIAAMGEIAKYALLSGEDFFLSLKAVSKERYLNFTGKEWIPFISKCCEVKARIVERDETEQGIRSLLNLGHTFAHGLEAATNYEVFLHGEAVAIGLYCASLLSYHERVLTQDKLAAIDEWLNQLGLPRRIPININLECVFECMLRDKKQCEKGFSVVLIKSPGECYLTHDITHESIQYILTQAVLGE